jgi:predicted lactoylglutathione lyase
MKAQIFINLPVKDLAASFIFYTKMGFTNNPNFSDESAKCMVFSDEIFVMLLTHDRFKTFVTKPIANLTNATALLLSLSVESVEAMNEIIENALAAGGTEPVEAKDHGFMQQRTLEDMDGHIWEVFYMDTTKLL